MQINMPEPVKRIIQTLTAAGYEAYAVGGCIRDSILKKEPADWDITTSAVPLEIKELFKRTVDTGIKHGTVTVMIDKIGYEVTTYRIDGEYEDGRHPKEVTFTASLEEDLKRRDFTINAMAYNDETGLVDIFHGMEDIEKKVIRCVGNPEERFTEDALRMMRAVRFSAQLGYQIEAGTKRAITKLAPALQKISAERIQTELVKLVTSSHPENLKIAFETGMTAVFFPEFDACMDTLQNNPHHTFCVGDHLLRSMQWISDSTKLRLTMLLHDIGKPDCKTTDDNGIDHFYGHSVISEEKAKCILRRLKFDNETIRVVTKLVQNHDVEIELSPKSVRRCMAKIGEDLFPYLLLVKQADVLAQSNYKRPEKLAHLAELGKIYQRVKDQNQCVSLKTLAVTGQDLIASGMKPGKEIGEVLQRMLEVVIESPDKNTKEYLMTMLTK